MVTTKDILAMQESNKKDRHELKNFITNESFRMDEKIEKFHIDVELLKQGSKTMTKDIAGIKTDMKEGFKDVKTLITENNKNYATKADHAENKRRLDGISKVLGTIGGMILVAIIGALLKLILIP